MIASVHIADVGLGRALRVLRRAPTPGEVPGLLMARVATPAPLTAKRRSAPQFGRVALLAFWEDDAAAERFLDSHALAKALGGGWHVRLAPLRRFGTWPGLPEEVPTGRTVDYEGPAAVLTLGRLKLPQAPRFLRTSAKAERAVASAPGFIWGSGLARPPFVATCSLWESSKALSLYAFGRAEPAHANAIATDAAKPFHKESAFIRFRPYGSHGHLDGRNPLPSSALEV